MLAATRQHCLYPVLFADVALADELDLDAGLSRQTLGVFTQLITERFREFRIIEDPYLALVEVRGHSTGVANLWQRAEDEHPVPATQHSSNLSRIPLGQKFDVHQKMINNALFGSGYAGLGVPGRIDP